MTEKKEVIFTDNDLYKSLSNVAGQGFLHTFNLPVALFIWIGGRNNKKSTSYVITAWFIMWSYPYANIPVFRYYKNMLKISLYASFQKWFEVLRPFCPNPDDWHFNDKDLEIYCNRREFDPFSRKIVSYRQKIMFYGIFAGGVDKAKGSDLKVGYWCHFGFDELQEQSQSGTIANEEDNIKDWDGLENMILTFKRRADVFNNKNEYPFKAHLMSNNKIAGHFIEQRFFKNHIEGKKNVLVHALEKYGYWQKYLPEEKFAWGKGLYLSLTSQFIAEFFNEKWISKEELKNVKNLKETDLKSYEENILGLFAKPQNALFGDELTWIENEPISIEELNKNWEPFAISLDAGYLDKCILSIGFVTKNTQEVNEWSHLHIQQEEVVAPIAKKKNSPLDNYQRETHRLRLIKNIVQQLYYFYKTYPAIRSGVLFTIDSQWEHLIPRLQHELQRLEEALAYEGIYVKLLETFKLQSNATFKAQVKNPERYFLFQQIMDSIVCYFPQQLVAKLGKLLTKNGKVVELGELQGQDEIDSAVYLILPFLDHFMNKIILDEMDFLKEKKKYSPYKVK